MVGSATAHEARGLAAIATHGSRACALLLAAVLALHASAAHAAEPRIVATTLTPETATVGDRLALTITVEHPPDATAEGPGFGANFGGLELVAIDPPRIDGGRTILSYELASFRTGRVTVPPQIISVRGPSTDATLTTQARDVRIESVLTPGETQLRPLKPQLEIDDNAPPPGTSVVFVAIFAALTALGYVLFRRAANILPPRPIAALPMAPLPGAAEVARAELDALTAAGLAATDVPEYYARIAATTRRYLSARFNFPAFAMTRRELEHEMRRGGLGRWPARLTANLLEQCGGAEFAAFAPAPERRADDLSAAYEIVALGESGSEAQAGPDSAKP